MITSNRSIIEKYYNRLLKSIQYCRQRAEITFLNEYRVVFKQVMKLGTLFAMDSLEKRDSAITNAIFPIKIQYPTELNDLTNLFGCQLYSGTNETYSCTYAIPDALL